MAFEYKPTRFLKEISTSFDFVFLGVATERAPEVVNPISLPLEKQKPVGDHLCILMVSDNRHRFIITTMMKDVKINFS